MYIPHIVALAVYLYDCCLMLLHRHRQRPQYSVVYTLYFSTGQFCRFLFCCKYFLECEYDRSNACTLLQLLAALTFGIADD